MSDSQLHVSDIPSVQDALSLSTCRYKWTPQVQDSYSHVSTLGLYHRSKETYTAQKNYKVYEVTSKMAYRPDLVSQVAYGDWRYWWVILESNDLQSLADLKPGLTLRIPHIDEATIRIQIDSNSNQDIFV